MKSVNWCLIPAEYCTVVSGCRFGLPRMPGVAHRILAGEQVLPVGELHEAAVVEVEAVPLGDGEGEAQPRLERRLVLDHVGVDVLVVSARWPRPIPGENMSQRRP